MVISVSLIWTFSILKHLLKCFVGPETFHHQSCRKTDTQFISVCLDYALRIVKGSGGNDRMIEYSICKQCFKLQRQDPRHRKIYDVVWLRIQTIS